VERFNRTIQNRLYKYFTHSKSLRYVEVLPKLVDGYNRTKHRTLQMRPIDVKRGKLEKLAFQNLYGKRLQTIKQVRPKYNVGDRVRITKLRSPFTRGYLSNFTREIFTIAAINPIPLPITYILRDDEQELLHGIFYSQELSRVRGQ